MSRSKTWIGVMFVLVMLLAVSSMGTAAAKRVTLNFIGMEQAGMTVDEQKAVIREFEKKHPGVTVNTTFVAYDALHDKLATALAGGGRAFDVMLVDNTWVAEFASAGWLMDVTDRITPEMKKATIDQNVTWRIVTYNKRLYGMPWMLDQKYFYYNEKMLKEAGFNAPPKTWEEMVEMARVMKKKGIVEYPIIWSWAQREAANVDFVALLYGFGGQLENEKGEPTFNDEGGLKALTFMVDTLKEGISNPASTVSVEEDVRNAFSAGKAAFAINWLYMYDLANDPKESKVAGHVKMALMPVSEEVRKKGIVSATCNDSMGFAVSAGSRNKELAWELVKYFTSPEVMKRYAAHQLPIWKDAFSDPKLIKAQPVTTKMFMEQFPYGHVKVHVPYYMEYSKTMQLMLQQAFTGQKTPKQALDDAVAQIKKIQERARQ
ncbi:MAG TPA: ABC transporter substrate-binding protein [Firmicutes bacterium]|nr:ABC transporter substrate-binding protein [Bacillota bacterium]